MGQPYPPTAPTPQRGAGFDHSLVTGAFELPNHATVRNFGIVRGIVVRSRGVVGSIGAGLQQLVGGNISLYTEMCERARGEAYEIMIQHAAAAARTASSASATTPPRSAQGSRKCCAMAPPSTSPHAHAAQ